MADFTVLFVAGLGVYVHIMYLLEYEIKCLVKCAISKDFGREIEYEQMLLLK